MIATTLTFVAAAGLVAGLAALGPRKAAYSAFRHTISELGETGARDQHFVAFGLFLPVGLVLLAVAGLTFPAAPAVGALALCVAVGYVGAASFPCDPGSPWSGSPRQAIHNIAGAVEYVGGGFALMTIARELGQPFKAAGFVVLAAAAGLSMVPANLGRGMLQRVAEACLFGGLGLACWHLESVA